MRSIAVLLATLTAATAACSLNEKVGDTDSPDAAAPVRFARARWAIALGGVHSGDNAAAVAIDPNGDVIVGGYFADRADFGSGPITTIPHQPSTDGIYPGNGFISKRSAVDGSEIWTRTVDAAQQSDVQAVAVDAAGDVLATGNVQGLGGDVFVRKYAAADGSLLWEHGLTTDSLANGTGIAVGGDGRVYVVGTFLGVAFGQGPPGAGESGTFLAAYDADGTLSWEHTFIGEGGLSAVTVALDGDLIASGNLGGSISFGGDLLVPVHRVTGALARFSPAGEYRWSRVLEPIDHDDGFWLGGGTTQLDGSILVVGEQDDLVGGPQHYSTVRRLDADGALLESSSVAGAEPMNVAPAPGGEVIDAGRLEDADVDLGTGPMAAGAFVASRHGVAPPVATMSFPGMDNIEKLATSGDGLAIAGKFHGTVDFGAGPVTGPGGSQDGFLAMFDWVTD